MRQTEFVARSFSFFGREFTYHTDTLTVSLIVSLAIFLLCLWLKKGSRFHPTRRQLALESLLGWFDDLLKETLGARGRGFLSFTVALFLFILISNWAGLIPGVLSPTRDVNTCLGLALVVLTIAHVNAIRTKGFKKYIKNYFTPYWWLFPSNLFSEISKTLSHGFRLYGNIFGGGIAAALIFQLFSMMKLWGVIPGLFLGLIFTGFLGFFMAGIQAFVFTMLAVSYIGVLAQE